MNRSALAFVVLGVAALACGDGTSSAPSRDQGIASETRPDDHPAPPADAGSVHRPAGSAARPSADAVEKLLALGYVDGVHAAPAVSNVTVYDPTRAWPGVNLYVSGHAQEAHLIDMAGQPLHRWSFDLMQLADEVAIPPNAVSRGYFRRAHLYPNGDLLVVYDNLALLKLDKDSNLLWVYTGHAHHDVFVAPAGDIYVLTAERRQMPAIHPTRVFTDNYVVHLDASGKELARVSVLEALLDGKQDEVLARVQALLPTLVGAIGDVLHTNAIEILDGRFAAANPAFERGNALVSCPHLHTIMVIDLERRTVVWTMQGPFRYQHESRLLPSGTILLFDNQRGADKRSAVREIDPVSGAEVWRYGGRPEEPLYSWCCGTNRRLPNGNTLIVETEAGRAIEVTPEREIVWEFVNPYRVGPGATLIAQLFDLERLPAGFPLTWAQHPPS